MRASQLLEPPGLLGRILLPLMLPCSCFFFVVVVCFVLFFAGRVWGVRRGLQSSALGPSRSEHRTGAPAASVPEGVVIPADAEQGALGVRVRCRGQTRSTTRPPNPSFRDGWPLPPWPLLGGALTGDPAANVGAPQAPCNPVGQILEAVSSGTVVAQFGMANALNLTFRGRPGVNSHLLGLRGLFTGSSPTKHNSLI